jgi:hypothetical protein
MLGRGCREPAFIITVATSCAGMFVWIDRITASSSTCSAIAGNVACEETMAAETVAHDRRS